MIKQILNLNFKTILINLYNEKVYLMKNKFFLSLKNLSKCLVKLIQIEIIIINLNKREVKNFSYLSHKYIKI